LAIPNQVEGASMETNFHNGDLLITNKLIQILNSSGIGESISYEYVRGDVIIFQQAGKSDFIKRIIAEEGDTIKFEDTNVIINNKLIIENYLEEGIQTKLPNSSISFLNEGEEVTVPQGKYFVMGDNREHSQDSRFKSVGWVDQDEIKGRVFLKYWPITEISLIPRGDFEELNISEE
jgi:signal peptidase I